MEFKETIELEPDTETEISEDFTLNCTPWRDGDSYLCLKTQEQVLLNINDCIILTDEEIRSVAERVGKVDLLLTQFSLSAWEGNPEDVDRRKAGAKTMLDRIVRQSQVFEPGFVIPFASFVWFCHEENYYINAEAVSVELVVQKINELTKSKPIVMYPSDTWELGTDFNSEPAVKKYMKAIDLLPKREKFKSPVVDEESLQVSAREFCQKLSADSGLLRNRVSFARLTYTRRQQYQNKHDTLLVTVKNLLGLLFLKIDPARIYIHDHGKSYTFDIVEALKSVDIPREACDIELGSDSLNYAFRFLWGGESLLVNGRFSEIYPEGRHPLFEYFFAASSQNRGGKVTWKSIPRGVNSYLFGK